MFLSQLLPLSTVTIGRLTTALFSAIILSQLRKKCCCLLVSYNCTSEHLRTAEEIDHKFFATRWHSRERLEWTLIESPRLSPVITATIESNKQTTNISCREILTRERCKGERLDVSADSSLTSHCKTHNKGRRATNIGIWIGYNEYYSVTFKNRKDNTTL